MPLKEVHTNFHEAASRPDGPSILSMVSQISNPFSFSKCIGCSGDFGLTNVVFCLVGCFAISLLFRVSYVQVNCVISCLIFDLKLGFCRRAGIVIAAFINCHTVKC